MGIKDQTRRIAAGASVALATSGLSNCRDNGAVDPPPPPLQCASLSAGESLAATGTRSADTVTVRVLNSAGSGWHVERVTDVIGATLLSTQSPRPGSRDTLGVVLHLASPTIPQVLFTVEATLIGYNGESCSTRRTFEVNITGTGVQVSLADRDPLPLAARQRAEIILARQEGRTVDLQAKTPWQGSSDITWTVSGGTVDSRAGRDVRWSLPETPGLYQAELLIDFGDDGFAIDTLLLEVV